MPASSNSLPFQVSQADLSDALGLSAVHVNRVMKSLKESHGVSLKSGRLISLDWDGLAASCDFDPGYLHHHDPAGSGTTPRSWPAAEHRRALSRLV